MCPKTSPDITQTLRRLDDLYAFLSFFFFSFYISLNYGENNDP